MKSDEPNAGVCMESEFGYFCHHDVEKLLRGSGRFSEGFVRKESQKWHPDRFSRYSAETGERAKELFQMIQLLIDGMV